MSPANTENRGRRVTDKQGGLLDAAQQAVRMERIEGEQRLLASQVKQSVDVLTSTLHALQSDTRNVVAKISELAGLQNAHDSNKVAIDEMKKSVGALNERLEEWFDDFDKRNQRRWEQYESNRDQWRREHEANNEDTKRDLEKEIRSVRETVIRALGWGAGAGALVTVVIGGFIWTLNYRFADVSTDVTRVEQASSRNRQLIDEMGRDHGKELADIKLYLARGGRIPDEPYVPQSQRNNNGNEQGSGQPRK